ncbi:hypothetical protein HDG40_005656 [Paraburkholderia sp. JPY158]|uniref:Uncharacterized protein n=1 Tax=Paraburkholderia atlantica TaxID=2654982 RepID=A0A7W8QBP6_PARAM|nr:hypothetical protein [Paraburkholderia atlantica]MBB5427477.1 hypothetical protein [Paraburkholderia atlantica]
MATKFDPMELHVPRNRTALMQQLQLLVGKGNHRRWCGGSIDSQKLPAFVEKMAARYPITRSTRGRVYDRKCGQAVVHFIAFPMGNKVAWWLLSDEGWGGLADGQSPDAHVARDAMAAEGHITFGDYVLLYATKQEPKEVTGTNGAKPRRFLGTTSTWTWKLRTEIVRELRAGIERCCERLEYGADGGAGRKPWGVRGMLSSLRERPQFSGIRSQVLALHKEAEELWKVRRPLWCARHPTLVQQYRDTAGALIPVDEILKTRLPKMRRLSVYGDEPATLRRLAFDAADALAAASDGEAR